MARSIGKVVRYTLLGVLGIVLLVAGLFVLLIGPWPTYAETRFEEQAYFRNTLNRLDQSLQRSQRDLAPPRLKAGWAEHEMTPPPGAPLAGYSARPNEKRCTGVHDPVFARALVFDDGHDVAALVGLDLLMVTRNIAEQVWTVVAAQTPLRHDTILFTSSHTHCGPGGYMPGLVGEYSGGAYDKAHVDRIANAISAALIEAYQQRSPARIAHQACPAPEFIHNRTKMPGVDTALRYLVVEKENGERCYGVRYSAHPTTLPEPYLEVSAEYPGALCRTLRETTGAMAIFLGGAVGAMGPRAPEAASKVASMEAMGRGLAEKILSDTRPLAFSETADVQAVGGRVDMPPMQVRPVSRAWRLSPLLAHLVGIPPEGWTQMVRIGDLVFFGLPYDSSGALAAQWADAAAAQGIDLWISSHCIAYCGYLSPTPIT